MLLTVLHSTSPGRLELTLVQVFPPWRGGWASPSLVPAQICPFASFDSAIANTTPAYSTPILSGVRPPEITWWVVSFRVRSGLSNRQVLPPSLVMWTCWLPTYTVL